MDWHVQVLKQFIAVHVLYMRPHYCNGQWKLHCTNTCSHTIQRVWDFLTFHNVEVISHAPHSPHFAPCDFFLLPTGKRDLRSCHFETLQVPLGVAETAFKNLVRNGFKHIFNEWQRRSAKCVALNGEYLEGVIINTE